MRKILNRLMDALTLLMVLSGILVMCLAIPNISQTDNMVSEPAVSEDMTANDESEAPDFWGIFLSVCSIFFTCIALPAVFFLAFIIIRDGGE